MALVLNDIDVPQRLPDNHSRNQPFAIWFAFLNPLIPQQFLT